MNKWLQEFNLEGKVAAITGAGGELCGAMARAFGEMGVKVALLDLDEEAAGVNADIIKNKGGAAAAHQCNVLDAASLKQACIAIEDTWGISLQHGDFSADKFSTVASIAQFIEACIDP